MQRIAQQIAQYHAQQRRVPAAGHRGFLAIHEGQAARFDLRLPHGDLFCGNLLEADTVTLRQPGCLHPGQLQEGFHQRLHVGTGLGDPRNLPLAVVRQRPPRQQFAGRRHDHQGGAQFMADIAGEQPLTFECRLQFAERLIECLCQLSQFVIAIGRGQWPCCPRRWRMRANGCGKANHRIDDPADGQAPDQVGECDGQ